MKIDKVQKIRKLDFVPLTVLLTWIPCVIIIFNFISRREIAALVAGAGFITLPLGLFLRDLKTTNRRFLRIGIWFFLITSALPIFLLRLIFWGQPFSEIEIGPIKASWLHGVSNSIYFVMILTSLIDLYIEWIADSEKK